MTKRRSAFIAAAALLVLALSGCVRFQADLTVTPDDTVNGSLIIAVVVGDESDSRDTAEDAAERIEEELLAGVRGAPGVERTVYDQDGYLGSRFSFRDTPLEAFADGGSEGALTLVRDGDEFVFTGSLDFAPEDAEPEAEPEADADTSNITVQIAFPGNVNASNGTITGTSVRWETSYEQSIEMTARASAIPTGAPGWVGPVVGVAALGLAIGLVVLVLVIRRRGSAARGASRPAP